MKLNDIFTRCVVTAAPEETLSAVAHRMQEHNVGTVVVVEEQRPVGIVTDSDLALALGVRRVSPQTEVQNVMTRHVLAIPEDTSIHQSFAPPTTVRRVPIALHLAGIARFPPPSHWPELVEDNRNQRFRRTERMPFAEFSPWHIPCQCSCVCKER